MSFKRMATIVSVRRLFRQTGCKFVAGQKSVTASKLGDWRYQNYDEVTALGAQPRSFWRSTGAIEAVTKLKNEVTYCAAILLLDSIY